MLFNMNKQRSGLDFPGSCLLLLSGFDCMIRTKGNRIDHFDIVVMGR